MKIHRKLLPNFALLFLVVSSVPVKAEPRTFEYWKKFISTTGFNIVLRECDIARNINDENRSYWGIDTVKEDRKVAMSAGLNKVETENFLSALARVMKDTCPEAW